MFRALCFAVAASFGVAGCQLPASPSEPDTWPEPVLANFMDACMTTSDGNSSFCGCAAGQLQATVSLENYIRMETEAATSGQLPAEVLAAAASCGTLVPEPAPTPPPPRIDPQELAEVFDDVMRNTTPEFEVSVPAWRTVPDDLLGEALCLSVDYSNVGRADGRLLVSGFSLVGPNGDIKQPNYLPGGVLVEDPPAVVPGARGSVEVCFNTGGDRGAFTARFEDISFPERNNTWDFVVS